MAAAFACCRTIVVRGSQGRARLAPRRRKRRRRGSHRTGPRPPVRRRCASDLEQNRRDRRLAKLATLVKRLQQELAEPLDFRCPTMVVTTLNGYRPTLNDIAAIINKSFTAVPPSTSSTRWQVPPGKKLRERRPEVIPSFCSDFSSGVAAIDRPSAVRYWSAGTLCCDLMCGGSGLPVRGAHLATQHSKKVDGVDRSTG